MKMLLLLLLIGTISIPLELNASQNISAKEKEIIVNADEAQYTIDQIILKGNASVEYFLGMISSNEMTLFLKPSKQLAFSKLLLKDDIKITFRDGAQFFCQTGELNNEELSGHFSGNIIKPDVIYKTHCRDKSFNVIPIQIKSSEMHFKMEESASQNRDNSPHGTSRILKEVFAENNVQAVYNHEFVAIGAMAHYQPFNMENSSIAEHLSDNKDQNPSYFKGCLTLSAEPKGHCQLNDSSGNIIKADKITIDTEKRQIYFLKPRGEMILSSNDPHHVMFSAEFLSWNDSRNQLDLGGQVTIDQEGIKRLVTEHGVRLIQNEKEGKRVLKSIETEGKTLLTYTETLKIGSHTHAVTSYGKLHVDHEYLRTIIDSPRDDNGKIIPGNQVHFQDLMGEMVADRVILHYSIENGGIIPQRIELEGNVNIRNQFAAQASQTNPLNSHKSYNLNTSDKTETEDSFLSNAKDPLISKSKKGSPLQQYAMADHVEYDTKTHMMTLNANKGRRVLFYDQLNHLQVSAPGLKIKRDPKTNKDTIQGVGDVRFTFIKYELEQIKNSWK